MPAPPPQAAHSYKARHFLHSLSFAINGLKRVFRNERNFRTHVALALGVGLLMIWLQIPVTQCAIVILCMGWMMGVEILNTALEGLVDLIVGTSYSEPGKWVKDFGAAACLITALSTALIGVLILAPPLWRRFFS